MLHRVRKCDVRMMNSADGCTAALEVIPTWIQPEEQFERKGFDPCAAIRRLSPRKRAHRSVEIVVVPLDPAIGFPVLRDRKTKCDQAALRRVRNLLHSKFRFPERT